MEGPYNASNKKVSKNIIVIARIKNCLPHQTLLNLYYTLIFPYFSYCNIIWGSNYKTYLQNLITVQKRAIRLICNLPRYSSSKASFCKLNLLTLENINRYQILLFMFRYHHNLLPKSFAIFFKQAFRFIANILDFLTTTEAIMHELGPKNFLFIVPWALALERSAQKTQSPFFVELLQVST